MEVSQSKGKDHFSGKESNADAGTEFQSDYPRARAAGVLGRCMSIFRSTGELWRITAPALNMSVHLRRKLCELLLSINSV